MEPHCKLRAVLYLHLPISLNHLTASWFAGRWRTSAHRVPAYSQARLAGARCHAKLRRTQQGLEILRADGTLSTQKSQVKLLVHPGKFRLNRESCGPKFVPPFRAPRV